MATAGIIAEYNPLHRGHVHLLAQCRRLLGAETDIVCVMSGDFVQRGDFALVRRHARARAAVESGADLVLELPLPWAVASAERFAAGGVQTLLATGVVTHLVFGSECADAQMLMRVAEVLESPDFPALLRQELARGDSFPAARARAAARLLTAQEAAVLSSPNDTLGVEYCKALLRAGSSVTPVAVPRLGSGHGELDLSSAAASATAIRAALRAGQREQALGQMAPAMAQAYLAEEAAGRAPVFGANCERAILARLRSMTRADFAALDQGQEGLYNRLYDASRTAATLDQVLSTAKTKRYAHARMRRMVLWGYLGITPADFPAAPLYLRPLAANERGRALLGRMRRTAALPVLTKPADVRRLGGEAQRLFEREAAAADLYTLGYPELTAAAGGTLWREGIALV